jgi:selenocysteine-specific elongation factor
VIVGTAGHIDHGKTSLVRALTGVDTDRLKEEKARGISIDLGFAYLPAPDGSILGFVDVPGHEKFIHNMLAGATGIDFVLLVVAADDGVMPQTREHVAIIDLLGIKRGIVALTKSDLTSRVQQAKVSADIQRLLVNTGLGNASIIPISTVTGEGIEELRNRLFDIAREISAHTNSELFRLAIDRSFTLRGVGTVVTGTVLSGVVSTGDRVMISPSGLVARVRSIHAQNRLTDRGSAGQRCALNLAGDGISKDAIARGQVVLDPLMHAPTDRIDVTFRLLLTEKRPVTQWMPARLHHAAAEVDARIVLLDDNPIAPGDEALVQLVLERPIAAVAGDRFVLRDTTAQRTIGGGGFLDLRAPARKRRTRERLAQLKALGGNAEKALATLLELFPHYVDLTAFGRDHALSAPQIEAIGDRLGIVKFVATTRLFALSTSTWIKFKKNLLDTLKAFHAGNPDLPGISLERLRIGLQPRFSAPAFLSILRDLMRAKEIALDGARVRLFSHEASLTAEDSKLWNRIAPLIGDEERFRPPRVRDLAATLGLREGELRHLFKILGRIEKVDEIAEDRFFLRTTVVEAVRIITNLSTSTSDGQFTAAQFRDQIKTGRTVAIQILEFFDRHGVTLRRGDLRRVNTPRLDLFGIPAVAGNDVNMNLGGESSPVGRPDFKSGRGRESVLGGFDSLSLPPK